MRLLPDMVISKCQGSKPTETDLGFSQIRLLPTDFGDYPRAAIISLQHFLLLAVSHWRFNPFKSRKALLEKRPGQGSDEVAVYYAFAACSILRKRRSRLLRY